MTYDKVHCRIKLNISKNECKKCIGLLYIASYYFSELEQFLIYFTGNVQIYFTSISTHCVSSQRITASLTNKNHPPPRQPSPSHTMRDDLATTQPPVTPSGLSDKWRAYSNNYFESYEVEHFYYLSFCRLSLSLLLLRPNETDELREIRFQKNMTRN